MCEFESRLGDQFTHHRKSIMFKFTLSYRCFLAVCALMLGVILSACSEQKTAQQKVSEAVAGSSSNYFLTGEESIMAEGNAKAFFTKPWPTRKPDGNMTEVQGYASECRNSDSNANGLVTCTGQIPKIEGGYDRVTRYCGYRKGINGCNDKDVAP